MINRTRRRNFRSIWLCVLGEAESKLKESCVKRNGIYRHVDAVCGSRRLIEAIAVCGLFTADDDDGEAVRNGNGERGLAGCGCGFRPRAKLCGHEIDTSLRPHRRPWCEHLLRWA